MKLTMQLVNFCPRIVQGLLANGCNPVNPPPSFPHVLEDRFQQASALQSVQQRIEGARTDAILVMLQLFHHRQAEDWLLRGAQEHMNSNQSEKSSR